jgi:hypothetical protein
MILSSCALSGGSEVVFDVPEAPEYDEVIFLDVDEYICMSVYSSRNFVFNNINKETYIEKLKITLDACNEALRR